MTNSTKMLLIVKKRWLLVALMLVIAGFFRLHQIELTPPGLFPDEAANLNDAERAWDMGAFKVFYPNNTGREGLFIALTAVSLHLYGREVEAVRLVSAIVGIMTVWGLYLLVQKTLGFEIAIVSGMLLATSFWHVNFSRIGFRGILVPFILVFAFYFLWRGMQELRYRDFAMSGAFWGLGLYTYINYRILPLVALLTVAAYWLSARRTGTGGQTAAWNRRFLKGLGVCVIVTALLWLPMLLYIYRHPAQFLLRVQSVSIFSTADPLWSFLQSAKKTLLMFHVQGDTNWRHNLAGSPMLLLPAGICFALGVAGCCWELVRRGRKAKKKAELVMVLSWLAIGLIPVSLTIQRLPHALRSLIVVPIVYVFSAIGLQVVYRFVGFFYRAYQTRSTLPTAGYLGQSLITRPIDHHLRWVPIVMTSLLLGYQALANYHKYFIVWAQQEKTAVAFLQEFVDLGKRLNELPQEKKKYVIVEGPARDGNPWAAETVKFITDTATPEKQQAKNLFYRVAGQESNIEEDALVVRMKWPPSNWPP